MSAAGRSPVQAARAVVPGMGTGVARTIELAIILLCVVALFMIFQPFSLQLFSIGCVLVVVGGLLFNLVPILRPSTPFMGVVRAAGIILLILLVVAALGIGSAELYVMWLAKNRAAAG